MVPFSIAMLVDPGMYFCEFPLCFLVGHVFLLLKIIARSFQLSTQLKSSQAPGDKANKTSLSFTCHLSALSGKVTHQLVNLMGTGKAPKKTAHIFGRES